MNVTEEYIILGIVRLLELDKIVVEGAGALGVAAIMSNQLNEFKGKKIVIVVTSGNLNASLLTKIIDSALATEGRYLKVKCFLPQRRVYWTVRNDGS